MFWVWLRPRSPRDRISRILLIGTILPANSWPALTEDEASLFREELAILLAEEVAEMKSAKEAREKRGGHEIFGNKLMKWQRRLQDGSAEQWPMWPTASGPRTAIRERRRKRRDLRYQGFPWIPSQGCDTPFGIMSSGGNAGRWAQCHQFSVRRHSRLRGILPHCLLIHPIAYCEKVPSQPVAK